MLFRMLGPVAVDGPDGSVDLGGPRHRVLLATLLTFPRQVVPVDRLVDSMWGGEPPRRAVDLVHVRISELRKLLREASDTERIATCRPGYLLDVAPEDVDGQRFVDAARAGRQALARGLAEGAAARLTSALAYWRGPALAELADRPFAQAEIMRWEHLRRQAVVDRIDADLAAGRHGEVIAELEGLVTAHPLHERHRGELMLALYRDGRQAEALTVYAEAVEALREGLGIDPGAELDRLHLAVLRQDPTLRIAARRAAPPPAPLASFVGRQDDLDQVRSALARARLVTLIGTGGSGKSRLAVEVARRWHAEFPDGVHVVELAAVSEAELAAATVASRIGVGEQPGRSVPEAIAVHIGTSTALLVLDNCEHLIDGIAALAGRLLAACPALRVLCTSRELLGVTGEVVHVVLGLGVPAQDAGHGDVVSSDAVRLFVDRATAVQASFGLSARDEGAVAEIVRRLDGLPLAIELAAARIAVLSPGQIVDRLADRFRLLSHGSRDAPPRHQTLRAVLEWSSELLTDSEMRLFTGLGVFAGSFTIAAVESVCADSIDDDVTAVLARLVDKSLVAVDRASVTYRYGLLETVRAYALDELARGSRTEPLRHAHATFYRSLAGRAAMGLRTHRMPAWLGTLERDDGNFRAAMDWSLHSGDAETAAVIAISMHKLWELRARYREGRTWLSRALAGSSPMPPDVRAWAAFADAVLALLAGDLHGGAASCTRATELGRACGDATLTSRALGLAGFGALAAGDPARAHELMTESERVAHDAPWARAWAVYFRSTLAEAEGLWELAAELSEEAEHLLGPSGDLELRAWAGLNRGTSLHRLGFERRAIRHLESALAVFGSLRVARGSCFALIPTALVLSAHGRAAAACLVAASERQRLVTATATAPFITAWVDETIALLHDLLSTTEFAAQWRRGEAMTLDEAVQIALAELATCAAAADRSDPISDS